MVFVGARLSSPGIADVRYDCELAPPREDDDWIFPVKGVRSVVFAGCSGSSRSSSVARTCQSKEASEASWIGTTNHHPDLSDPLDYRGSTRMPSLIVDCLSVKRARVVVW